jgi:anti-sigma regulatory factor (Ser/Thr protein kinase)
MAATSVLLCTADLELQQTVSETLACSGRDISIARTQREALELLDAGNVGLTVVDVLGFVGALGFLNLAQGRLPAIAVAPGNDLDVLNSLVCEVGVTNVIARPVAESDDDLSELYITAEKILRDDLFGLDKYISGHRSDLHHLTLTNARDRDSALAEISAYLKRNRASRHLIRCIENAADELITNAMYNAPVTDDGAARYASTNRRIKIDLAPHEHVSVCFGVGHGTFGLSVNDNFGRLELSHLRNSIERCSTQDDPIEQKDGGAGLGLFLVARTARQFVVNVDPGNRTEVIALWSLENARQVASRHSLHYFEASLPVKRQAKLRARGTQGHIPTALS